MCFVGICVAPTLLRQYVNFPALLVEEDLMCFFLNYFRYEQTRRQVEPPTFRTLYMKESHVLALLGFESTFRVVDLESLAPYRCGFPSRQGLIIIMWGSYPASSWNVGGSTLVPARVWYNSRRDTWGLPPPVKLKCLHKTFTLLERRKTEP